MNRLLILLLAAGFVGCNSSNSDEKPLSSDLVQLENQFAQAIMKKDRATLDRVVTPEFTVTGIKYMDSAAVTRSVWMTNILHDMKLDSVHFIDIKSNSIDDVGIVRARFFWKGTYGEKPFADTTSFVDTWIKRNNDWRIVSRVMVD
jgi:hypothetical protein